MPVDIERARAAVRELLLAVGEDPDREGLQDTPDRVARAWEEMLAGHGADLVAALRTTSGREGFTVGYDQMVVVARVPFASTCEHHLMPFRGRADVAYLPSGRVVGLSKVPRMVRLAGRRLQVQERLTSEVADALANALGGSDVAVRVTAEHTCASCRGVGVPVAMVTQDLRGRFRQPEVRDEFDRLVAAGDSC